MHELLAYHYALTDDPFYKPSKQEQSMSETQSTLKLTYLGAQKILNAGIAAASEMGVPQCISVVDQGGHLIAFARMDGAFSMSLETSLRKAQTAACYGVPSGDVEAGIDIKLAIGTDGKRINLPGGLPIIVEGNLIGGIGVGSGTGAQDLVVAKAGVAVISGSKHF